MSVEAVETLMEETAEAQDMANVRMIWDYVPFNDCFVQEISRLIGGTLTEEDDEAILEELAEIERLEADELALNLPTAPTTTSPEEIKVATEPKKQAVAS